MTTLIIADHENGRLNDATLRAVSAAAALDAPIHILVAGNDAEGVAGDAARISGVSNVLLAQAPQLAYGLAENLAAQVLSVAAAYTHLVFGATATGKSAAPRVAAELDVAQISEVIAVINPETFKRPIYAGNAVITVRSVDAIKVLTVRTAAFPAAEADGGDATVQNVAAASDTGLSSLVRRETSPAGRRELTSARVVVAGGRGLGSAANFALLNPLAEKLGAAIGASRAAVDSGYAPNDSQVGQTGKIVAPELYIAVGISGAIQHLAGMKDSRVIVAINKDPEAPIFGVADYGMVSDLFEAVPALVASL